MEHDVTTIRVRSKEGTAGLAFKNETRAHLNARSAEGWELVSTHMVSAVDRVDLVLFWKR